MRTRAALIWMLAGILSAMGCDDGKVNVGADAGVSNDGTVPVGSDTVATSEGYPTRESYCAGNGPPIIVGTRGEAICTGSMAQVAFRYALCSCETFESTGLVSTDGFDHTQGIYDPQNPGTGAALGINGNFEAVGELSVGGPLSVAGSQGVELVSITEIQGTLRSGGPLDHAHNIHIAKDAFVDGDIDGTGELRIDGTLTQPAGKRLSSSLISVGAQQAAPVNVDPPCDCSEDKLYDIAGYVRAQKAFNDNEVAEIDPTALVEVVGGEQRLVLPCGRFYLDGISATADVVLEVQGRVALFIGGTVNIAGSLRVEYAPGAELDLFIEDGFNVTGTFELGDKEAPTRLRMYVGGKQPIDMVGGSVLSGNLYAPRAKFISTGNLEVYGALFVKLIEMVGELSVHYDRAILEVGTACEQLPVTNPPGPSDPTPPPQCTDCRDCGNQACVDGKCGECREDADCCAPLLCREGRCLAPIL